jgi:hypothetical protein
MQSGVVQHAAFGMHALPHRFWVGGHWQAPPSQN